MTQTEIVSTSIAGVSLILSLILGIPALIRAGRAETRADRIEARDTERHDADWQFRFRAGDVTVLEIFNAGADDAHTVVIVAEIDGVREYEERELVHGRERDLIDVSFPFLRAELERVSTEDRLHRARTNGLGSVALSVTVNVRVNWTTAIGTPKTINFGPHPYELS